MPFRYEGFRDEESYPRVSGILDSSSGAIFTFRQYSLFSDERYATDVRQQLRSEAER